MIALPYHVNYIIDLHSDSSCLENKSCLLGIETIAANLLPNQIKSCKRQEKVKLFGLKSLMGAITIKKLKDLGKFPIRVNLSHQIIFQLGTKAEH